MGNETPKLRSGSQEEIVLRIVHREQGQASGRIVRDALQEIEGRTYALTTAGTILDRLEQKGFVESRMTDPIPERGGATQAALHDHGCGGEGIAGCSTCRRAETKRFPYPPTGEGRIVMNTRFFYYVEFIDPIYNRIAGRIISKLDTVTVQRIATVDDDRLFVLPASLLGPIPGSLLVVFPGCITTSSISHNAIRHTLKLPLRAPILYPLWAKKPIRLAMIPITPMMQKQVVRLIVLYLRVRD